MMRSTPVFASRASVSSAPTPKFDQKSRISGLLCTCNTHQQGLVLRVRQHRRFPWTYTRAVLETEEARRRYDNLLQVEAHKKDLMAYQYEAPAGLTCLLCTL